ncbi:MAG: glycosyl transferase, partial [Bacteroidaceae bacterium]|nr:glycosyl transferase [Bacteroidaceae bacterium]
MGKHAYLILAHNEVDILKCLLKAIDDERNDVYIHWDAKVKDVPALSMAHSSLFTIKNRVDVRWGDFSMVKAEYALFKEAFAHGGYDYYHLLSGVDMPLMPQDEIHTFFDRNAGKEFIGYSSYPGWKEEAKRKMRWHLFPSKFQRNFKPTPSSISSSLFLKAQDIVGINRFNSTEIRKGTQWISVTNDFVEYMLSQRKEVKKLFSHTFCSDEMFAQTLCWNSPFRNKIFDISNEGHGCMRAIGWRDGVLHPWTEADYDELMSSGCVFARKFTSSHMEVVEKILNHVT